MAQHILLSDWPRAVQGQVGITVTEQQFVEGPQPYVEQEQDSIWRVVTARI